MADYWADLDQYTRPGSAGTALDPFGLTEFLSDIGNLGPNTYHLRGRGTCDAVTGTFRPGARHIYIAWDVDAYGPWGLDEQGYVGFPARGSAGDFYDCILYLRWLDNAAQNVVRAFVYCSTTDPFLMPLKSFDMVWPGVAPVGTLVNSTILLPPVAPFSCGVVAWNAPGIATGNLFGQFVPDLNHVHESHPSAGGDTVLYTGNATSSSGWAEPGLTDAPVQSMPVDGGGNIYGIVGTKPLPAFAEADLTAFDMYAGYGVGAPGCWAASPTPPAGSSVDRKRRLHKMGAL